MNETLHSSTLDGCTYRYYEYIVLAYSVFYSVTQTSGFLFKKRIFFIEKAKNGMEIIRGRKRTANNFKCNFDEKMLLSFCTVYIIKLKYNVDV